MIKPISVSLADAEYALGALAVPLPLAELVPGSGSWEVELGFGKGRYLLRRAGAEPGVRFLGVEMAGRYFRLARRRRNRKRLRNVVLLRGEALYLMSVALPREFAAAVHVYFPDPWPKSRQQKRRLFDSETVDLVLGLLAPAGCLYFATDYLEYGELVESILDSHPAVAETRRLDAWSDGARTNYEAKYESEGRQFVRLVVSRSAGGAAALLHPEGRSGILAACSRPSE